MNSRFAESEDRLALVNNFPSEHIEKINRFNLPDGSTFMGGLRGHIFMTRPDLNILNTDLKLLDGISSVAGFIDMTDENSNYMDKKIVSMLQHNTGFPSAYMPVFTNHVKGYSPEDQSMDVIEMGESLHGTRIKYGKHLKASRSSGTITLTFDDSKYLPIYKSIALWTDYIEMVFFGDIKPKRKYIRQAIIDYASSLYYLVTKEDGRELVYWEKLIGLFPRNRPDAAFGTTKDQFTFPEYSIQFEFSMKGKAGILDPYILAEMNTLSKFTNNRFMGSSGKLIEQPLYDIENDRIGEPYVNAPMIERGKEAHNRGKYFLTWV